MNKLEFTLCSCSRPACPILKINKENREVNILDDYNGKVVLTFDELNMLIDIFNKEVNNE